MKGGFRSADYHTRLLYRGILRDKRRAAFQRRPYQGPNRRSGRRSNITTASAKYALQAPYGSLVQVGLGFHPALAYKYSGECYPSKVVIPSEAEQSRAIPWRDPQMSDTGFLDFARDDKETPHCICSPRLFP